MRRARISAVALLTVSALVATGCASSKSEADSDVIHITPQTQHAPNLITASEIEASGTSTAMQAIQRLRPQFLVIRGGMSKRTGDAGIVVYSNGARLGDTGALTQIPAAEVKSIEYLNPNDATQRFGQNHTHGAILVTRK